MQTIMTQTQLQETLQTKRAEWNALLAQVDAQHMTQPGATGTYSVKDVIAHIAVYEEWAATIIAEALQGEHETLPLPINGQSHEQAIDERNARFYAEYRDLPLADVQNFASQAYHHLLAVISTLSDEQVNSVLTPEWTSSPLRDLIAGDSYDHYDEHIPSLRAWIAQQNQ